MKRNTGRVLDVAAPLGRDYLPHRDGVGDDPQLQRKPGSEAVLSTDKLETGHEADISAPDYKSQEQIIENPEARSDDNDPMDLGTMIRLARVRLGMRQVDLARRLRVKQSAISQWESGKFTPDIDNRIALAAELHIALHDLMPEAENIPDNAFQDPQNRRIVANLARLDAQTRAWFEILTWRLAEWHEKGHPDDRMPPLPPTRTRRRRR